MVVDVKNLIAAINPDIYCEKYDGITDLRSEVKKLSNQGKYLEAAKKAKLINSDYVDVLYAQLAKGAFEKVGLKNPVEKHTLVYDAFSQNLEPIYFWILDYVNKEFDGGAEKLVDNFISSPGSGHFAEMQGRVTRMQDEGMKIMGQTNTVIRSIINIVYDLKEMKLFLAPYEDLKSSDENRRMGSLISLKQRWMDNVDIKRGTGSINMLAQQLDFVTIRDAFMAANTLKDVSSLDLNDRVKRILLQRVSEFERWIEESEKELKKRFEIEKIYLKSQVNSARLYARWAKPYLKAARDLEQNATNNANIVNAFNTAVFELVLLAKGKYDILRDISAGELPQVFQKMKFRKYVPITIIEFVFRTIPDRADQRGGYSFRGRAEITFTSFALNEDELKVLKEQIEKDDFGDVYKMINGATEESFGQLSADLDELMGEKRSEEEKQKEKESQDIDPFSALFSWRSKDKDKDKKEGSTIEKDSENESVLRSQAILGSRWACRKLYGDYKKAHGMPALPPVVDFY
jgi:hypothetical protein